MTARPPLDAVLLDAGGTLVRIDFEWIAGMLGGFGISIGVEAIRRGEVEGRRRYDASAGPAPVADAPHPPLGSAGDTRAYFRGMLEAAGVPPALLARAEAAMHAREAEPIGLWSREAEGAREALDRLAALGLELACVSNSDGRAEAHLVHNGVREGLAFVVDSQLVGVEKPDPEIFRIALRRLAVAASRALYVGDIACVDVRGARAAGMHVVLIDPFGDYAGEGTDSIRAIGDLPGWVAARFETPQSGGARPADI